MNLIFANKYYFLESGAARYLFDLQELLVRHGHMVAPFAMRDGRNQPSAWDSHFVSPVQTDHVSFSWQGLRTAGRFLYSFEARREFAALLKDVQPDLVHVHNIYHQISPSILPEAKRRGVPVVMTAHDYKLIAPNYSLFHHGKICRHTFPHRYCAAIWHRCVKDSMLAGVLEAVEMGLHRALGLWSRNIDRIIAPSAFVAEKLAEYGVEAEKIVHLPHFIEASSWQPQYGGEYALFVGRLSAEKGVDVLIRAAAKNKNMPIRIVGVGPAEKSLRALSAELKASNVTFAGWKSGADLRAEYAGAKFLVVPSLWYEVFGLIALEAAASGKPVVASRIGGLGEVVRDGETGLLATVGDADDLAEKMEVLWRSSDRVVSMGQRARQVVETEYDPETHYRKLMQIYQSVM